MTARWGRRCGRGDRRDTTMHRAGAEASTLFVPVIGAGLRTPPKTPSLFERVVDTVDKAAPEAAIANSPGV